jgi:sulfatase maturation enzyme AslB (radical SAM superfamily)
MINKDVIDTAVDFFYPFLKSDEKVHIGFYGGEPLLAYNQIKHTVHLVQEKNKTGNKNIRFTLTTNGTLVTEEKLDFFNRNRFALMLSFDGLAQEKGRQKGTLDKMVQVVKQVRNYPDIDFEFNSVFAPQTIDMFSGSLRFMIEPGGPEITFSISTIENWKPEDMATLKEELEELVDYLILYYKKTGKIPVKNFQAPVPEPGKNVFRCPAGTKNMAVSTDGKVWGCFMFHDYFKSRKQCDQYGEYAFGTLEDFIANHKSRYPEVRTNYADLHQDLFKVGENFCFTSDDIAACSACPVNAAYTTGSIGTISERQYELNKIQLNARRDFWKRAKGLCVTG